MDKFDVRVEVRISKVTESGGFTGENLSVAETVQVQAAGFMEVCKMLGQFHDLAERVRAEHSGGAGRGKK